MPVDFSADVQAIFPELKAESWPAYAAFTTAFGEELTRRAEFSFSPDRSTPEITVEGEGQFFGHLGQLLQQTNCVNGLPALDRIRRLFADGQALVKTSFVPARTEVSCYFRTGLAPARGDEACAALNLPPLASTAQDLAMLLGQSELFLGVDFATDAAPTLSLFYIVPQKHPAFWPAAASAMAVLGIAPLALRSFIALHPHLASQTSGYAFYFSTRHPGGTKPRAKVDYEDLPVTVVREVLAKQSAPVIAAARALGTERLSYLGVVFGQTAQPAFKVYFRRRYLLGGEDETDLAAAVLRETRWK